METFIRFIRTYWARTAAMVFACVFYLFALAILFIQVFRGSFDHFGETMGLFVRFVFALAHLGFAWFVLQYFRRTNLRARISHILRRVFRFRAAIGVWMAVFLALHIVDFSIKSKYIVQFASGTPVGMLPWEYGVEMFIRFFSAPVGWMINILLRIINAIDPESLKRYFFLFALAIDFPVRVFVGYVSASILTTAGEEIQVLFSKRKKRGA